ncbi:1,4-dihydroxy-2-naphthoate phytyltransferase [Chloropicon primus]|uniref:1,4-dihydroxy-2-naphthoate phytyltransferase n=1 Tax=Chloropicon primus TaxID=1764295 RepID=A0A5B8MSC0_9CHLO|nr:1,4-dihydroxy-2-naphthoate phytyltransferase [Chloropicon primus]UPR02711.1 1,4-dihydroxy-2-naphthoate phytyltransferase [Chloropicon primus]|mmetsp:Transcript_10503/g.29686  ORF Transcript_10503/g.29686 Transcript_10503/m.29686 type:complete len:378 (-) Transcript_10503:574-1707(-)|eukprot:QDZ23499.1 1,4-dihydroxy-2-naphthoate phytyltransferase [Chloropicon primus]
MELTWRGSGGRRASWVSGRQSTRESVKRSPARPLRCQQRCGRPTEGTRRQEATNRRAGALPWSSPSSSSASPSSRSDPEPVIPVIASFFVSPLAFNIACLPLILATSVAFAVKKEVLLSNFLLQGLAGVLVIVWLNLTNDVFDSETGADVEKAESVVNRTGEKEKLFWAATALLAAGIGIFALVVLQSSQAIAGAMLLGSVSIGYIYQGPPFRLSYKGVGEILCFFAFGPLATNAFYLLQSGTKFAALRGQGVALGASVLLGLTTSNILLNSHYHQIDTDRRTGKMSPCVRFGTKAVSRAVVAVVALVYGIYTACLVAGVMPRTTAIVLLSFSSASQLCRFVLENHANKNVIKPAKFLAVKWHRNFVLLLSLGLFLS